MQDIKEIYENYCNSVYKYLICLSHDKEISEELTQDTFYIALKNIKKFREECPVDMWLCKIARNLWYKEIKKLKRDEKHFLDNIDLADISKDLNIIESDFIKKEELKNIKKQIEKLDNETKEVINLRIYGDLSFRTIGNILGKSEVWSRVTFYRGKEKIKQIIRLSRV